MNVESITTLAQVLEDATPAPTSVNYKVIAMLIGQAESLLQLARDCANAEDVEYVDGMAHTVDQITIAFDDASDIITQMAGALCDIEEPDMEPNGETFGDMMRQTFEQFQKDSAAFDDEAEEEAQDEQRDSEAQMWNELQDRLDAEDLESPMDFDDSGEGDEE